MRVIRMLTEDIHHGVDILLWMYPNLKLAGCNVFDHTQHTIFNNFAVFRLLNVLLSDLKKILLRLVGISRE